MVETDINPVIINSIGAAGIAAATVEESKVSGEENGVSGTIINESKIGFRTETYSPSHGYWLGLPNETLDSVQDILWVLKDQFKWEYPGTLINDAELLQFYDEHYLQQPGDLLLARSAVTTFSMTGPWRGSEGLIRLIPKDSLDLAIYLLIRKTPGERYGAGVSIMPDSYVAKHQWSPKDDLDGGRFIEHIIQSDNKGASSFFSDGLALTAGPNAGIKVEFEGALSAKFIIKDA